MGVGKSMTPSLRVDGEPRYVMEYNDGSKSHWLGMNAFADLTHDEKEELGLMKTRFVRKETSNKGQNRYDDVDESDLPEYIDWVEKGAVGPIKNQAMCGSCWAFSTTGAIEGVNALVTGEMVSLSEQMLIDCDTTKDHGCKGGLMDFAFDFVVGMEVLTRRRVIPTRLRRARVTQEGGIDML
eukprot:jgi/Picre1/27485/NNA_000452.t1